MSDSPTIRLAVAVARESLAGSLAPRPDPPALLVAYPYLSLFQKWRSLYAFRNWALDSGAFTAHTSGKPVDHEAFLATAEEALATDPELVEVFALDVIGDWRASLRNCEEGWKRGLPLIPTYHAGEPEDYLLGIARDFPKIALGGVASRRGASKTDWAGQCLARVWPCRVHGFGFGTRDASLRLPFHSVDASNWAMGPCAYGKWESYGNRALRRASGSVGAHAALRTEVDHYLKLEREARHRWKKEMRQLDKLPTARRGTAQQAAED